MIKVFIILICITILIMVGYGVYTTWQLNRFEKETAYMLTKNREFVAYREALLNEMSKYLDKNEYLLRLVNEAKDNGWIDIQEYLLDFVKFNFKMYHDIEVKYDALGKDLPYPPT